MYYKKLYKNRGKSMLECKGDIFTKSLSYNLINNLNFILIELNLYSNEISYC